MLRNFRKKPKWETQHYVGSKLQQYYWFQANEPMRKPNIRSSPRFKSGKHFIYNGIISYYSTRHSLMGATDEVHLRTETRVLLKKQRKKSLASVRFSKQIARSVQGMLDAVTPWQNNTGSPSFKKRYSKTEYNKKLKHSCKKSWL